MSIREKLIEFHRAVDVPVLDCPTVPSEERLRLRGALCIEEPIELLEGLGADPVTIARLRVAAQQAVESIRRYRCNIIEVADAIADTIYVAEGTNLEFGINGHDVFEVVHRANMAKVGGLVREDGKRLKPPGWTPPDIKGELRRQGWTGRQGWTEGWTEES